MQTGKDEIDNSALDLILEKVFRDGGYDFRDYRREMLVHRLERRLRSTGMKTYPEYMQFLDTNPEEYRQIAEDITLKTGTFFSSQYTFQKMKNLVIPELIADKRQRDERKLTVWSAACALGEEPYSLAIMLSEFLGENLPEFDISVFATDISQRVLEKAGEGVYSAKNVEGVPPTILKRYFDLYGDSYRVKDNIRRMLRFSSYNLASTEAAPFDNVDCIFCRNLLMYLPDKPQERVVNLLYDCLAASGYLVLGEVETLPYGLREKLACLDIKARIYQRI